MLGLFRLCHIESIFLNTSYKIIEYKKDSNSIGIGPAPNGKVIKIFNGKKSLVKAFSYLNKVSKKIPNKGFYIKAEVKG